MALALLATRRFLPLFTTQFLGALNDNLFKNAMVVLLLWRAGEAGPVLVAAAGGVFILPYALFSSMAGELADGREMAGLIRLIKLFEIALMVLGMAGLVGGEPALLMAVLFGLGVHSTFFGPLKYAILPAHLAPGELVAGNGLVEAGTFVAILIGTIAGGGLVLGSHGDAIVALAGIAVALAGYFSARFIPPTVPAMPGLAVGWNVWRGTAAILRAARANPPVWQAILGISWFWTVGATLLSQFPVIATATMGAGSDVVTIFLAVFSIGVGAGSLLAARLLRGVPSTRHVPWAVLGISLFTTDFVFACEGLPAPDARVLLDLFALAVCGGIFSVPLYTIMQARSDVAVRSRVIAANNVMNAAFMVAGAVAAGGLAATGLGAPRILLAIAVANLGAFAWFLRVRT